LSIEAYIAEHQPPVRRFQPAKGQEDVVKPNLAQFTAQIGIYLVGTA
jgi:hypothetical protein